MMHITKRGADFVVAFLGLLIAAPLMVAVALVVKYSMGRPVLFRQMRPGRHGKPFMLLKFRTMANAKDANGQDLPDGMRLTPVGKFLRSTSLDELPQLLNVFLGEMSFVGPRPLLMEYLDRYNERQAHRHDVRPGITGWAQINGRNAASWADRLEMDAWYAEHQSLALDLKILWRTFFKVFKREGVSQYGHVTCEKFMGDAEAETESVPAPAIPVESHPPGDPSSASASGPANRSVHVKNGIRTPVPVQRVESP